MGGAGHRFRHCGFRFCANAVSPSTASSLAIVRRGINRAELPATTSVTLLLDTLAGGAMMHALSTPPDKRAALAGDIAGHARRLVDFLLHAVTAPAGAGA